MTETDNVPVIRALVRTLFLATALAIGVVGLLIALVAEISANHASQQALAGCHLYKTVAEAPLAPGTSPLGLQLAAGARVAYYSADCKLGALSPADSRVVPLLPAGTK